LVEVLLVEVLLVEVLLVEVLLVEVLLVEVLLVEVLLVDVVSIQDLFFVWLLEAAVGVRDSPQLQNSGQEPIFQPEKGRNPSMKMVGKVSAAQDMIGKCSCRIPTKWITKAVVTNFTACLPWTCRDTEVKIYKESGSKLLVNMEIIINHVEATPPKNFTCPLLEEIIERIVY